MYGPTIKRIRQGKDLSIKHVYTGVCSKTNAIKFENGERSISAEKFYLVLQHLMISMDEFQWIMNGYQPPEDEHFQYLIAKTWNTSQNDSFQKLVQLLEREAVGVEQVQQASYQLLENFRQGNPPQEKELALVIRYFSDLRTWTLKDLAFFANNCYLLPYDLMCSLLNEALGVRERYAMFRGSDEMFAALLSNCINRMIIEQDAPQAKKYLSLLRNLSKGILMCGYKLLVEAYEAKILFMFEDEREGKVKLQNVLEIALFLQQPKIVEEIEELLADSQPS